jgi:hypothetical protein
VAAVAEEAPRFLLYAYARSDQVAMGLQRLGDADPAALRRVAAAWAKDHHPLVRRAAVAGVCEPPGARVLLERRRRRAPGPGFDRLARWAGSDDPDVRGLVRENLRKARLRRADPDRSAGLLAVVGD